MKIRRTHWGTTIQNFKKMDHETVGDDGRCRHQRCALHHKGPLLQFISDNISPGEELMSLILQKIFHLGPNLSDSYQSEHDEQKKWPSSHPSLTTHPRPMNICHRSVPTSAHWPKSLIGWHFTQSSMELSWPLVQINIPKGFLNLVEDRWPKTTEEERWQKVQKMILPTPNTPCLAHEPKNGPTRTASGSSLVKTEPQILQWGDGQRSVWQVRGEGKTALQSANREEVSWWYTSEEMQGHRDSNHHRRTSSLKKEGRHLKTNLTTMTYRSQCLWRKTIVSLSLHKYITAPHIIKSSSICTLLQYRWHKTGFIITSPVQPPVAAFSPLLNHVWQFATQGRSKFLIQNCPFQLLLNFYKSKFPIFWHTFYFQIQHLISL